MSESDFRLDTSQFDKALKSFAMLSQKASAEVLKDQARLFVRDAVSVTPPNTGKLAGSKKKGQATLASDIAKIMRPVRLAKNDPQAVHKRFRSSRGRVGIDFSKGSRDRRWAITRGELRAYMKKRVDAIGYLASGWNAAAQKLGTKLPSWITNKGVSHGSIAINLSGSRMSITITNSVKFVGGVQGLNRKIQWALDNRAKKMIHTLKNLVVRESAKKSGFR